MYRVEKLSKGKVVDFTENLGEEAASSLYMSYIKKGYTARMYKDGLQIIPRGKKWSFGGIKTRP